LATHYCQTWQHLPDYGVYHATLIADPALLGKWQPDDSVAYVLVYREMSQPEAELVRLFIVRLKETLEIPILDEWAEMLWKHTSNRNYVHNLTTGGDCLLGARIDLQAKWQGFLTDLLKQGEITLTV
jgi:hypothetical protein